MTSNIISRITDAIIRQEGMKPDALNPGNLRAAPWMVNPTIQNNFWVPPSREAGIAGIAHVVALRIAKGQSLKELITAWAPSSDGNDTESYIRNVQAWCEIAGANQPLWNFIVEPPS